MYARQRPLHFRCCTSTKSRRRIVAVFLIAFIVLALLPGRPSAHAAALGTITVNSLNDSDSDDGLCTLREAVYNASFDDQTGSPDCAAGAGADTILFSVSGSILLTQNLPSMSGPITVDGSGQTVIIDGGQDYFAFHIVDTDATFRNLTIQNTWSEGSGPAIMAEQGLILENVNVLNNVSQSSGGGVYAGGTTSVLGSRFEGNKADWDGGGLYAEGRVSVENSSFVQNEAALYGAGGGLWTSRSLTISNTVFLTNTARQDGGGALAGEWAKVHNSSFAGNQTDYYRGGGLSTGGTLEIVGSDFVANAAGGDGGGASAAGAATVDASHFTNNSGGQGGGLATDQDLILTASTFSNNVAVLEGGGIRVFGDLTLTNSTFTGNQASNHGAGAYALGSATVTDSEFVNNRHATTDTGASGGGIWISGALRLERTDFISNTAAASGGGVYANSATILSSNFEGNATQINFYEYGGGAVATFGTVNISDTLFINNTSLGYGGAVDASYGGGAIRNCRFERNQAAYSGGALYSIDDITLADSRFTDNRATGSGGGASIHSAVSNSHFERNQAGADGGGLLLGAGDSGAATVSASSIISNVSGADGGGLYIYYDGRVIDTDIIGNVATEDGGGLYSWSGIFAHDLEISASSIISNNAATGSGGGAYLISTTTITDTLFQNNTAAGSGGGIYGSGVLLHKVRLFDNTSGGNGGGIRLAYSSTLNDVDISRNSAQAGGGFFLDAPENSYRTQSLTGRALTFEANAATTGGAIYVTNGQLSLTNARILTNTAALGGAMYLTSTDQLAPRGVITVTNSCIVSNSDTAVHYARGKAPIAAKANWWGTPDGPSGAAPGQGDSVSTNVDFADFLTSNTLGCPELPYTTVTPTCYALALSHSGSGSDPAAAPASSPGCPNGQYVAGQAISLQAAPAADWQVLQWSGTGNDASTAAANSLVMPAANHTVSVTYTPGTPTPESDYSIFLPDVQKDQP